VVYPDTGMPFVGLFALKSVIPANVFYGDIICVYIIKNHRGNEEK
jgi:hypothetical protein